MPNCIFLASYLILLDDEIYTDYLLKFSIVINK